MGVIEGTYGPLLSAGVPGEGTDAVQMLTIDGPPTGGSFRLRFGGVTTDDIDWSVTDATLVTNVAAALAGVVEVQTITFAAITSGTFRLRFRGQLSEVITWSNVSNTLRDRVDSALEALSNIGTAGVVTAVGTMTSGLGTLTVTWAGKGPQLALEVADKRLVGTGASMSVARTTPGSRLASLGPDGVSVAEDDLTSGVGTIAITFDSEAWENRVVPLIEVASNDMTSDDENDPATVEVSEDTPGVTAFGRGIEKGGLVIDVDNADLYINQGVPHAPDYLQVNS